MLGFIKGFIRSLNPKIWFWLIGAAIVGWVVLTVATTVRDYNEQWRELLADTKAQVTEQANLQNKLNFLEEAARRNQNYIRWQQAQARQRTAELQELNLQFEVMRDAQQEMTKVLDPQRLSRLASAKPGLIEIRANKATARVFRDLEEVFRD